MDAAAASAADARGHDTVAVTRATLRRDPRARGVAPSAPLEVALTLDYDGTSTVAAAAAAALRTRLVAGAPKGVERQLARARAGEGKKRAREATRQGSLVDAFARQSGAFYPSHWSPYDRVGAVNADP